MHEGGWITFGLGHWLYGVVIWGIIIVAIIAVIKGSGGKD